MGMLQSANLIDTELAELPMMITLKLSAPHSIDPQAASSALITYIIFFIVTPFTSFRRE